ncbi:MAG: hypothetical protein L6V35_02970 [Alistipes putredinis]|nr:MAG: hypothetical protein L6V35_02970 [Alistipes putredinis]
MTSKFCRSRDFPFCVTLTEASNGGECFIASSEGMVLAITYTYISRRLHLGALTCEMRFGS